MSACVTLEEVLAAAHARCASLVPETSGYLALAVGDATSRLPLRLDDRAVLLTTEGTVTVRSRGEPVAPAEAARLLRDLLARLLSASAGSMPNLAATARPRPASEQDPDAVARELEAALIPVNRNAARRALARLARETLRAKEAGRLRRARAEVQARPAAQGASDGVQPPPAPPARAPREEAAVAAREPAAVTARDEAAEVAPPAPAPAIVELTLSPGPVAPAIVELTLSPGLVACETAGRSLSPAIAGEVAGTAAVERSPERAAGADEHAGAPAPSTHAAAQTDAVEPPAHAAAQAEAFPEPTPTVVQAVVEVEADGAPAEIPLIPELIEPVRSIAPVAPIASSSPIAPAVEAVAPAEARAVVASSPVVCGASAYGEALTGPEGIEVFLVDFSPAPAVVEPPPREPTPTESILVELSPDPAGVVPLSQEPTPTVATAVWAEMVAAEGAVAAPPAEATADVTDVPPEAVETARAPDVPPEAVETARAPAIHYKVEEAAALQVTPAYGGWPLVHREHLGGLPVGPRAAAASVEETPAARHTLPWPLPAPRSDDALPAPASAPLAAPALPAEASLAVEAVAPVSAPDVLPPTHAASADPPAHAAPADPPAHAASADPPADAAPAEEPCPAGLGPIDAIVWSASRRSPSARPPADGAGASRVDELVARFVAQSEHSAQRRAARSMKALAGLDLTLTPPPVASLSASAALALPGARPPLSGASRPIPSERAAPAAEPLALDEDSRPPSPVVTPRRRGLSLWLALVALALLCAGLAGTLRPELFASIAGPLARGVLHLVPHAEARTPPPRD
ncbi:MULTISPECIES: hypothetical protein [Sorangium]|uniref:Uncharacterized protein n=1 Tax=Sorangium cellulosum TaxID=56 RepID=A0A4V0NH32_SORCE|nr:MULTISPECIES: hypothetical protein [Sorangium]AUX35262.1 hypothetical protein SOCE836_074520 [Sorangium cellulosum]WCQ94566.1 hypothetical protein NQZ70_07334 [Sorangium sp. Soce836]